MRLVLSQPHVQEILQHALADAPREACGIVAGRGARVERVIALPNIASNPQTHYRLDDAAFVEALNTIDRAGQSLLGFYHSHPQGEPIPSTTDIQQAVYPDAVQIIVGLSNATPRLAAWQIRPGQVLPVEIVYSVYDQSHNTVTLSNAQQTAVLLGALLGLMLMLVISISLLPPAPPIP